MKKGDIRRALCIFGLMLAPELTGILRIWDPINNWAKKIMEPEASFFVVSLLIYYLITVVLPACGFVWFVRESWRAEDKTIRVTGLLMSLIILGAYLVPRFYLLQEIASPPNLP